MFIAIKFTFPNNLKTLRNCNFIILRIDDPPRQFLAVANHGGDPVTKEFENSTIIIKNQIPSTIYEFNLHRSSFEELQSIETNGFALINVFI